MRVAGRDGIWGRVAQVAGPPVVVAAGAALLLRLLAGIPSLVEPCPDVGGGAWDSVARAEAALGVSLWLPAWVPPGVAWPPRRIECVAEAPLTVRAIADLRGGAGATFELTQALGADASAGGTPDSPVSTAATPVAVNGEGHLQVERAPDGRTWRRVTWAREGRRLTLRAPLDTEELLRAARSVGPPAGRREGT